MFCSLKNIIWAKLTLFYLFLNYKIVRFYLFNYLATKKIFSHFIIIFFNHLSLPCLVPDPNSRERKISTLSSSSTDSDNKACVTSVVVILVPSMVSMATCRMSRL